MGAGEEGTPTKSTKPASSLQEVPMTPVYPDWTGSMQAFYGAGATPPFFASTVTSPTPHPYMWGSQHPMMSHYGTPVPYPALYPPGGVYVHPNMSTVESRSTNPMTPGTVHGTAESDGKATEGKDCASIKKTKGTSGNHGSRKTGDSRKAASGSGNDVGTQSAESESEGSSDASDDNNNQEFSATKKGSFDQMLADAANAHRAVPANFQTSVPGNPVGSMHPTNINMGMDLWNASSSGAETMKLRSNPPGVSSIVTPSGMMNDQWIQDERELKRQKRKQSNRESARRSRLRKQAECEELQQRVELLSNENHTLRDELQKLSEECEKLTAENSSIKEELTSLYGPDAISKLENSNCSTTRVQSHQVEGNS